LPPEGFEPERLETWPKLAGRLEYVNGRLLFMPPCSDEQQDTVADVVITLGAWVRNHSEFLLGTNEAGMRLANATRAADAAVWRRSDTGAHAGRLRRHRPVLAVEVAGVDDPEPILREKAEWYLSVGVSVVWLVLPGTREVVVISPSGDRRLGIGDRIPAHAALPDLEPAVQELFVQISEG
jgi:Uma2 family endonuclease